MGTKRQRAPHFIAGLGDGNVRNQPRLTNDDLFPTSQRLTPYIRSRRNNKAVSLQKAASIFHNKDAFSDSGDGIPTAATNAGPWQVSAMALLCVMGLLVGLFLHLVMDSASEKQSFPPRRVRARTHSSPTKKKKTDEWSDDEHELVEEDPYGADNELYYHGRPQRHAKSKSGTLHHRMPAAVVGHAASSTRHAAGTSPGPTLRTTRSIDSGTGVPSSRGTRPVMEGVQQQTTQDDDDDLLKSPSWRGVSSLNARPLSPISSFASIGNRSGNTLDTSLDTHEGDEETGTPPRRALYQGAASFDARDPPSSRLLSAGTEDDLETPRAGTRTRNSHVEQLRSSNTPSRSLPPPPIYEAPQAAASDKNFPFIPDLTIQEAFIEPTTEQSPRPMSIEERRMLGLDAPAAWQGNSEPHAAAYPGHLQQRASPLEAPPSSNEARKNIVHKRENITHCTDAESSLMSSVDFKEISLDHVIGGGGFGQVWAATWRSTPVAVKILTGSAQREIVSKAILEEFAAEINMLKGMRHPNICLYMGASLKAPNRAIITELAANGSLWDALRLPLSPLYTVADGKTRDAWPLSLYTDGYSASTPNPPYPPKGTWPWALVKRVACGAARGMTYLHSGTPPVLHRDMKSANILLDDSYTAKVCDFGLSRLKAQERSMTGNCGTVQWMAPEVLANQRYAEPADVYSFGIIVWEMLTGECPYDGMSAIQCALAVLNRDHRPEIPAFCPPALAALIKACLDKDPSKRPTFAQILLALDAMP